MRAAGILCVLLLLVSLPGCSDESEPIADLDFAVTLRVPSPVVEYGAPFPLEVELVHRREFEPAPWNDEWLAPLVVQPLGAVRDENSSHVRERLQFRAFAFARGPVLVPSFDVTAEAEGRSTAIASTEPLHLDVQSALGGRDPQRAELLEPLGPAEERAPFAWWYLVVPPAALGLYLIAVAARRRRLVRPASVREDSAMQSESRREDPLELAQRRLATLRAAEPADREADRSYHVTWADLVRELVASCWGHGRPEQTTREWHAALSEAGVLPQEQLAGLHAALQRCDRVKFAGARSDARGRAELLRAAESLLGRAARSEEAA